MLEDLYKGLYDDGDFTGTLDDFQTKMQDLDYRQMLHGGIVEDGRFTGDFNTFEEKYAPAPISADPLRQKNKLGFLNIEKDNLTWRDEIPYKTDATPEQTIENLFHIYYRWY